MWSTTKARLFTPNSPPLYSTTPIVKRWLILLLKVLFPALILYYLVSQMDTEKLQMLRTQPKNWWLLGGALLLSFSAVCLSFVRWWLLVRTLGLPFRMADAFRLGFLGYLMSFVSAGAVGGDLFKAVFIAREQPGRRAEAVATVLVDRIVGLYALLVVASIGILLMNGPPEDPSLRVLCPITLTATIVGGVGLGLLTLPSITDGWLSQRVSELPYAGRAIAKVISGVRMYKNRPGVLLVIAIVSVSGHIGLAISLYLIAAGLFATVPSLLDHLLMGPLAMIANSLPLTPGGLGQLEAALERLYATFPQGPHNASGMLVGLVFRLTTFAIAGIGALFYIAGKSEVQQVMDEAHALEDEMESHTGTPLAG